MNKIIVILSIVWLSSAHFNQELIARKNGKKEDVSLYTIEGVILTANRNLNVPKTWLRDITLSIDNGEIKGFVRLDGRFLISGVQNGSHILQIEHPDIYFQPVKVEITGKGKYRARKVNYIQPSIINQVPYPLRLQPLVRRKYFRNREQWRIIDVILNPMVLVMVLPLLLMLLVPKIIKDPEAKKELDSIQFPKINDMPDLSDMLSSFLSGKKRMESEEKEIAENTSKKKHPK
ncbi:ER membrane protein complex subunit 7 homolog [Drosophila takahashii]|uniref:ER membrane protein complex subunit 7 homolog n=1 Tax=Drosophila takahashii TaxID=29030 RepID=UPI001CF874F4|nr:ER membrane protein complex subunit 7 homolog [Drosophila takahashii]